MNHLAIRTHSGTRTQPWPVACNKNGVRVTPKSTASTSAAPAQSGAAKSGPVSFLDMLSGASADSTNAIGISDSKSQGQPGKHSGGHDSEQPNNSSADATQTALLSSLVPVVPSPIVVNTPPAGQTAATTNLDGATKASEPISSASGLANATGVLASTTQIAPSLLADSATAPASSFQNVAAEITASGASTSKPADQKPLGAAAEAQSAQPSPSATELSRAAKTGLQQVMSKSLQPPPQAGPQNAKSNPTDTPAANQNTVKPAAGPTSPVPSNLATVATNLSSLPLSSNNGTPSGTPEPASPINNSLRASSSQTNLNQSATNAAGKSSASNAVSANQAVTSNGSSHDTDNNNQQNSNSQSSAAPAPMPIKSADAVVSPLVPTPPSPKTADAVSAGTLTQTSDSGAHHSADLGSAASEPLAATASAGAPGINAARVIQSMSGTEMRVGMHSSDFGEISIHTTLSQLQLQTQISVNHSELGSAIATHIPAMQAKLGSEHGVHASIEVSQSGSSLSGNAGQSSPQRNQKAFVPAPANINDPAPVDTGYSGLRAPPAAVEESRLDIRA